MQNTQQPLLHACSGQMFARTLQRPYTRGLHQIFGDMPIARQQQSVAPQSRQMLAEFGSECLIANDDGLRWLD